MHVSRHPCKKAVIIGGTSGIGLATARMLVDGGARVLVTGHSQAGLESAQKELGKGGVVVSSDAASLTDGLPYNPNLGTYEKAPDGRSSGVKDDMWAFTSRNPALDLRAATTFAAPAKVAGPGLRKADSRAPEVDRCWP